MKKFVILPILLLATVVFAQTKSEIVEEVNETEKVVEDIKTEELSVEEKIMIFLNKGNYIYFSSYKYFVPKQALNHISFDDESVSITTRMPRLDEEIYISYELIELDEFCNLIITNKY